MKDKIFMIVLTLLSLPFLSVAMIKPVSIIDEQTPILQALLDGQLFDLIRAKAARRAIDYGINRYTLANLQALHAKVVSMLDTNNQQPLLAVAQRLAIAPYDMWNYLQAIKQDLETAMSQRR